MIDLCVTTIAAILVMCKNEQASCFNCLPDNKSFVCWNCLFFSKCLPKLIPHSCSVSSNVTRLTYWSSTVAVALSCQCRHCCICSTVLPALQEQQQKSNIVQQHYQIKDLSLWATARAIQAALATGTAIASQALCNLALLVFQPLHAQIDSTVDYCITSCHKVVSPAGPAQSQSVLWLPAVCKLASWWLPTKWHGCQHSTAVHKTALCTIRGTDQWLA